MIKVYRTIDNKDITFKARTLTMGELKKCEMLVLIRIEVIRNVKSN